MSGPSLLSRFQGAILGTIFGDCLGAKFEKEWAAQPYNIVTAYLDKIKKKVDSDESGTKGSVHYTDDSCMTFDLGESLVEHKGYNPQNVAKNFSETYFVSPAQRFYGGNVTTVFYELKDMNYKGDVYKPAREQFNGSGSYGNGSAMRVSPVPLFHHNDVPSMVKLATEQSKLTHTNAKGINGAILQALAIEKAMNSEKITDPISFCKELKDQLNQVATDREDLSVYDVRMNCIVKFLKSTEIVKANDINAQIGSGVIAHEAVPAAIFSFLYTLDENRIPQLSKFNGLVRATVFAVAFSEDCDTVGCMAAAIAGAYYGVEQIPKEWVCACEGADRAMKLGRHTASLIFLHGSGDTGVGVQSWVEECFDRVGDKRGFAFKHVKVIYPTAPPQPYAPMNGRPSNVWFDRKKISYHVPEVEESVNAMSAKLSEIVQAEIKSGIPVNRIIVGGFSMGGAMAFHLGYRTHPDLRGVFALSSFLNEESLVYDAIKNRKQQASDATMPELFMANGTKDWLVLHEWGQKSFEKLKSCGVKGQFHSFNFVHEIASQELDLLRSWVQEMLPDNFSNKL